MAEPQNLQLVEIEIKSGLKILPRFSFQGEFMATLDRKTGRGCDACDFTGYRGRIGIYEMLRFNDALRQAVRSDNHNDQCEDWPAITESSSCRNTLWTRCATA